MSLASLLLSDFTAIRNLLCSANFFFSEFYLQKNNAGTCLALDAANRTFSVF